MDHPDLFAPFALPATEAPPEFIYPDPHQWRGEPARTDTPEAAAEELHRRAVAPGTYFDLVTSAGARNLPPNADSIVDSGVYVRGQGGEGVHLRRPQPERGPGLTEGTDYPVHVACHSGDYHLRYTNDLAKVTCPRCLSAK